MGTNGSFTIHDSFDDLPEEHAGVHVWFCDLDDRELVRLGRELGSEEERSRAEGLGDSVNRHRYLARAGFVRQLLADLLKISPTLIELHGGPRGSQILELPYHLYRRELDIPSFSISHSENVMSFAAAYGRNIGIDVELAGKLLEVAGVAEMAFTYGGSAKSEIMFKDAAVEAFHYFWTKREALAKARGDNVVYPRLNDVPDRAWMLHSFQHQVGAKRVIGTLAYSVGG